MSKNNGNEISPMNPGWLKRQEVCLDDELAEIFSFFVINTPCINLSSSGMDIKTYGWDKDVWQKGALKKKLIEVGNLQGHIVAAKKLDEMKRSCIQANLTKGFQHTDTERIVYYKPDKYNECMAWFLHIRNALAHGRFAVYLRKETIIVLEDGKKKGDDFQVRSRMVLKISTLLEWIRIIKSGKLD